MLVTHDYKCIDEHGGSIPYHADPTHRNTKRLVDEAGGDLQVLSELLKNSVLCYKGVWQGSAFCLRRSALDLAGFMRFIDAVPVRNYQRLTHQDQPVSAFCILDKNNSGKQLGYIDEILFDYRIHGQNSSGATHSAAGATRSAERAAATVAGTRFLVGSHPHLVEENSRQERAWHLAMFLYCLYTSRRTLALGHLMRAARQLSTREMVRELIRLSVVSIFGLEVFLRLKQRKLRPSPPAS
jgi:hypothetical protein